jgi:hypothetical protein
MDHTGPNADAVAMTGGNLTLGRSRAAAFRTVALTSIAVTATCAPVGALIALATGTRFMLAFVMLRWLVVLVLLVTPILYRTIFVRQGWTLPYVMQTPLTALLLTIESIGVDILSARLHG